MTTKEWLSQYPVLEAKYYRMYGDESLEQELTVLRARLNAIENAIEAINDPLYSEVLRLRYMDGDTGRLLKWKDVAFAMYHSDTEADLQRMNRLHRKALAMVKIPKV